MPSRKTPRALPPAIVATLNDLDSQLEERRRQREATEAVLKQIKSVGRALQDAARFSVEDNAMPIREFAALWAPLWRTAARELKNAGVFDLQRFEIPEGTGCEIAAQLFEQLLSDPDDRTFDRDFGDVLEELWRRSDDKNISWNESIRGTRVFFWEFLEEFEATAGQGRRTHASKSVSDHPESTESNKANTRVSIPDARAEEVPAMVAEGSGASTARPRLSERDARVLQCLAQLPGETGLSETEIEEKLRRREVYFADRTISTHVIPRLRKFVEIESSRVSGYRIASKDRQRARTIANEHLDSECT